MDTKEKTRVSGQQRRSAQPADARRRTGAAPRSAGSGSGKTVKGGGTGTQTRRRQAAAAAKSRTRRTATVKQPTPDVVYTQPVPFNKYRFLLQLATVVAVVLALLFGMSIFFKVKTVTVIGNAKYSAWDIREASGIQEGENMLTLSEPKISSSIRSKLPYVDYIRVGIKLPDTVKIEVVELDVVYAIEAEDGSWWLMRSDGGIVEKTNNADAQQHTKILGVKITQPASGEKAVALQLQQTTDEGETVPVTVLASEQLQIAVNIAQFLEDSGVIGEAASIDVTDPGSLELWYGQRYQVTLGDAMELGYKIRSMKSAIDQMGDYQSGILDVSFTTWPDEVGYTPFP
jgi:hypothetical protein